MKKEVVGTKETLIFPRNVGQQFPQVPSGQHHSAQWLKRASELPLTI